MITNRYGPAKVSRLKGESVSVFKATDWGASYSHHPQITSLNGKLLATWSIGHFHEDGPGQKMVLSTSTDSGRTWTRPSTLVAPANGEHGPTCVTSGGLYISPEGITAYYASYDHTLEGVMLFAEKGGRSSSRFPCVQDVYTGILHSRDGGNTWQEAGKIPGLITNLSPVRLTSGRLILTGHRMHAWTDDPIGIAGWTIAPLPGLPEGYYEGVGEYLPIKAEWAQLGICEGAVYEIPGRPLRLVSRTNKGRLAISESPDGGVSWDAPRLTDFTDCSSRLQFGRLPDGRFFALSCPDPNLPEACLRRTPLVLAVSTDGDVFDRHYIVGDEPDRPLHFPGSYKHGRYGYPYAHFSNDRLFVINSVGKEDVECHLFDLSELD